MRNWGYSAHPVGAHIVRPSPVLDSPSGLGTQRAHRDAPLPMADAFVGAGLRARPIPRPMPVIP